MKYFLMGCFLVFSAAWGESAEKMHLHRTNTPTYLKLAWGTLQNKNIPLKHPWPFTPLSIGHTNASYQNYGDEAYFHPGLDIRGDAGTSVLASTGGKVVNIENYIPGNDMYWEVAILDDQGFLWQYHHIDHKSIPQEIHAAFKNGTRVNQGDKIGEIVYWPIVSYGERYHHVHLNVLDKDKNYLGPFAFLDQIADTKVPEIKQVGLFQNGSILKKNQVKGSYNLFVEVYDLIMHDKFFVPPHLIEVVIDQGKEQIFWEFTHIPGGGNEYTDVDLLYLPTLTCGNYSCRKIFINLSYNNTIPQTVGHHTITVRVSDFVGNQTQKDFEWDILP